MSQERRTRLLVTIPRGLDSKMALLHVLAEELRLPDYFGWNWDALHECLCDLSWIEKQDVVLFHEDLSDLAPEDMATYVSIVRDAETLSKARPEHRVIGVFPSSAERAVPEGHVAERMDLRCQIVRWVSDEPQPGWVEARFTDALGKSWTLFDKSAIFAADHISADSTYPRDGVVRCETLRRSPGTGGIVIVRVVAIDSKADEGVREFDVEETQLTRPS
jgi:hypothetical protein